MQLPVYQYRAAGGVVLDEHGKVLVMERTVERNGKSLREVRLPKGHVEDGETDLEAAKREVAEESGYSDLELVADLGTERSEFENVTKGVFCIRESHFFLFKLRSSQCEKKPDHAEEALFENRWLSHLPEARDLLTYEAEKIMIERALHL